MMFSSKGVLSFSQRIPLGFGTPSVMLQVKVTLSSSVTGRCGPDRLTFGGTSREKKKRHWFYASFDLKMTHKHLSTE